MIKNFFVRVASKIVTFGMCFMPKATFLRFMRKRAPLGMLDDVPDEDILLSQRILRKRMLLSILAVAIGTLLGHVLYKKFHAC